MKVFKFGGASVKDADAVKNVLSVVRLFPQDDLTIVVSAMGKTTNAMEKVVAAYCSSNPELTEELIAEREQFHGSIMHALFAEDEIEIRESIAVQFQLLREKVSKPASANYDYEYDQIVSFGELISTRIISRFLTINDINSNWFDARHLIRTNSNFREGKVDWAISEQLIKEKVGAFHVEPRRTVAITQGFIGHTDTRQTTTLGREGSDFSGGILAWCLDAESLTIWKDVPGMLNADPKWFDNTVRLTRISYREAIELAYYGATIIHPKTIKPLQNKSIPLYVKSFLHPEEEGTLIQSSTASDFLIPSFIFKMDQVLISVSPPDFSFIVEESLSQIFQLCAREKVKINLSQNSALNFSMCVDDSERSQKLIECLQEDYLVKFNKGLELVTIRHYDQPTIDRVTQEKEILVEQKSRYTARMVMRNMG